MAVPLDQLSVSVFNEKTQRDEVMPALHPQRKENVKFVLYQPPPVGAALSDRATWDEYKERLTFISDDLHWLLALPHDKFWCQIIFDISVHHCIDSYLRYAPRSYDVVFNLADDLQTLHDDLHRSFFMVCVRMATHKESKEHFITPVEFGKIIYENFIFDIPKLMDLSVLYGAGNGPLLTKMIRNIFVQQLNYKHDLNATVPTVLEVLQKITKQCGIKTGSDVGTPLKLQADLLKSPLLDMDTAKFQDIIFYLSDTANTLWSFIEIYPEGAKSFAQEEFPSKLAAMCEGLFPALLDAINQHEWSSLDHRVLLKVKVMSAHVCLLKVFRQIVYQSSMVPLLDDCSQEEAEMHAENYLQLMSSVLGERRFLAHLEYLYPFAEDRDILSQSPYPVDETRLQFVQDAVNESFAMYGRPRGSKPKSGKEYGKPRVSKSPSAEMESQKFGSNKGQQAGALADTGLDYETADVDELGAGACAPSITGVELDSLITSVKDLLPELGEGFIELCLEEMNYNVEKVINMVLEDKLPPSLQDYSKSLQRESKKTDISEEPSMILAERRNIYDFDEFDVFSRDEVDTSRIHKGKKEKIKPGDAATVMDDKSGIDRLRPLYDRYGSEFVESMYDHEGGDYDDEYDDTYDSNLMGVTDADSADELTVRRPFTVPRVLGGNSLGANKGGNAESSEEEEEESKPKDLFLEDPAKIRQRQEERRAQKEAMRRKPGQGQGQRQGQRQGQSKGQEGEGQKKYDVTGKPKGQGQDADVVKNRSWKEKNKATRVHHNRKALSDKKRKF